MTDRDWHSEEDYVAEYLKAAALRMIAERAWTQFGRTAMSTNNRYQFEELIRYERDRLIRDNPIYEALPPLHVSWHDPSSPCLYWQRIPEEMAQAIAEIVTRLLPQ